MYADDLKIFSVIKSQADVVKLQKDLDAVSLWAANWRLNLNASKCKSFKITLKNNCIQSTYSINGTVLENVTKIRDLGVVLDQKLTFSYHIDHITCKANRALGLLIRTFQSASPRCKLNKRALLAAYYANVRSVLEYCSVIWGGAAKSHVVRVERIQHKFLMWLATHAESRCTSLEYSHLLSFYNVSHLHARRVQSEIMFICKILKGHISSAHLLGCFGIHVPGRATRGSAVTPLNVPSGSRVNTVVNSLYVRGPRHLNDLVRSSPQCDIFCETLGQIKHRAQAFASSLPPIL